MPRIILPHCFITNKTRDVLYKQLRKGKDRGKIITISWIDLYCDKCKKFISRKRLKHKTNDRQILCEECAKEHYKKYQKEYSKKYPEKRGKEWIEKERIRKREYMRIKFGYINRRV